MLKVGFQVRIEDKDNKFFVFNYLTEFESESSWQNLTDTARIVLPRKLQWQGVPIEGENGIFERGKQVTVSYGYDGELVTIFSGYVSKVLPKTPFELECQDAMYLLKQKTVTKSYQSVTLSNLLKDICPIPYEAIDVNLGKFQIKNVNVANVLDELNKAYALKSFVRDGKLFVGLPYNPATAKEYTFEFQKNIISDELEYRKSEDIKIKVKAISILPNNQKITVELGDADGEQRTLNYYNKTESELREIAKRDIENLKYEGYAGSFTTFGSPYVRHGDRINLIDKEYERSGTYLVKKVKHTAGMNGLRQEITLDRKL